MDCYVPYDHSHNFTLGKEVKKICPTCKNEMKIDAQVFGNEYGQNKAALWNTYECECGQKDKKVLYEGQPKTLKEIFAIAESTLGISV